MLARVHSGALPLPRLPLLNRARDVRRALLPAGEYPEYDERRTVVYFSRENKNYKNQARRPLPLNGLGCIAAAGAARLRVHVRLSRLNIRIDVVVRAQNKRSLVNEPDVLEMIRSKLLK